MAIVTNAFSTWCNFVCQRWGLLTWQDFTLSRRSTQSFATGRLLIRIATQMWCSDYSPNGKDEFPCFCLKDTSCSRHRCFLVLITPYLLLAVAVGPSRSSISASTCPLRTDSKSQVESSIQFGSAD